MWNTVFDVWSVIHIIMFFILALLVFAYTKKAYVGFSIILIIAVAWEVIERFLLAEIIGIYTFTESPLNSLADLFIYDIIGTILGYIYVKKTLKKKW